MAEALLAARDSFSLEIEGDVATTSSMPSSRLRALGHAIDAVRRPVPVGQRWTTYRLGLQWFTTVFIPGTNLPNFQRQEGDFFAMYWITIIQESPRISSLLR